MPIEDKTDGDPAPQFDVALPTDMVTALAKEPAELTQADRDTLLLAIARALLHL